MAKLIGAALIACAIACAKPTKKQEASHCLPLPAAVRSELTASPDGSTLYWLERVYSHDYDSDLFLEVRLMRYSFATQRTDVVFEHAGEPLQFVDGLLLATRNIGDTNRVVIVGTDGHVQELTPTFLDVLDVELLDAHTLVFLADGLGARALYTLDLRELRPYPLVDAEVLFSTSAGRVFARAGDQGIAIDATTRKQQTFAPRKRSRPNGDSVVYVDDNRVGVQPMTGGEGKTLISAPRDWKLTYQIGSVLARTPPRDGRSYAFIVADGRARELPTIVGGASILGTTSVGTKTWALVGHNTSNYAGDLANTNAETDVCLLPADGEVTFPTRNVPARFLDKDDRLFEALATTSAAATLAIIEVAGSPTTVSIELKKELGERDLDGMRKRTHELQKLVTSILGDREIRTEVTFADGRTGFHRWRRDRLRARTTVGMGDALLTDPTDFDFEVSNLETKDDDGRIVCKGTLRNLRAQRVDSLDIKCSGNRSHLIHMTNLEPNEARPFSQTFEVSKDRESAFVEVLVDGKPFEVRDTERERLMQTVFELATDIYAATRLSLREHRVDDDIVVDLTADSEFLQRDQAAKEAAASTAYQRYEALRGIYQLDPKSALRLRIEVQPDDVSFTFDGMKLSGGD